MMRQIRRMREEGYERSKTRLLKNLKIGYLDIEATNLNGNFGYILSWYIKPRNSKKYDCAVIKKSEIFNYDFDKRVVKELLQAIKKYDVIYTHYGSDRRFDFPFIRTRAYINNLEKELPEYMETFIMDTYPIARNKLKLNSNRLGTIAEALGIAEKKTPVSGIMWMKATAGDPKALSYVTKHNQLDVDILEKVHIKLEKVERPIYRSA